MVRSSKGQGGTGRLLAQSTHSAAAAPATRLWPAQFHRFGGLLQDCPSCYDPGLGRWISQDPTKFQPGDPNFYPYIFNVPTYLTDPTGKNPFDPFNFTPG